MENNNLSLIKVSQILINFFKIFLEQSFFKKNLKQRENL